MLPNFSALLKAERARLGCSQVKLGELSGVHPSTINSYERGFNPTLGKADKLLRALGVTMVLGEEKSTSDDAEKE